MLYLIRMYSTREDESARISLLGKDRFMQLVYDLYALIFARPAFYRANRFLFRLALSGMGILNWRSERLQGERGLLEKLLPLAPDGAVVLDVGANEGRYSEQLLSLAPRLRIHAFEPNPTTFARLRRRMEPHGVRCWNVALGASSCKAQLFDYADRDGSSHASLHSEVFSRLHHSESHACEIEVRRLDEILEAEGITDVFLVKIDTEGTELQVLEGLGNLLSSGSVKIRYLQLEFNEMDVVSRTFLEDVQNILPGYRVYRILPRGALLDITDERPLMRELFAFQNILFSQDVM